jgi:hypothetical protein
MSRQDIVHHPGGCAGYGIRPAPGVAPVSDVIPVDAKFHHWRLGFRQYSFRHITRVPQRIVLNIWTRPLIYWHATVPFTISDPGKPLDPGTSLRFPPDCVGDMTERLVAHSQTSTTRRAWSDDNRILMQGRMVRAEYREGELSATDAR